MKFCYIDESGTGEEPCAVMAGIIVDIHRMHVTKADWMLLLEKLSKICSREIKELHTKDLYSGNDIWRRVDAPVRTKIISEIFSWLKVRKHNIVFTALDKQSFVSDWESHEFLKTMKSQWCFMGLHLILSIQKAFQQQPKNKGNTVFIFDRKVTEETKFGKLVNDPPDWIHAYYDPNRKQLPLDQIVDVPYYGDSEDVHLIQIADLTAYVIRRFLEINHYGLKIKYADEHEKIGGWMTDILSLSLPLSTRYPARSRSAAADVFYDYAPALLRTLG